MQFLKDIERDMKQMNLSAEQKEVRMLKLQAIEETPHPAYLPEEQETVRKMARLSLSMGWALSCTDALWAIRRT